MSWVSGYASSHVDLLDKLKIYITATIPVGDRWISDRYVTTSGSEEFIAHGSGYSSTDTIYIGIKAYNDVVNDNFAWVVNGFTGFNSSLGFYEMPGAQTLSDLPTCVPLLKSNPVNTNAIKYWFFADAAHIKVVARTGTVYHQCYLGLFLPYGTPVTYSYSLAIGGSAVMDNTSTPPKNSVTTSQVQSYFRPWDAYNTSPINSHVGSLCIKEPGGSNLRLYNTTNNFQSNSSACSGVFPYVESQRNFLGGYNNMRPNLDGTYSMQDVQIISGFPANILGSFIGLKYCTLQGLTSEDVITDEDAQDWLVVQDSYHSDDISGICYKLA